MIDDFEWVNIMKVLRLRTAKALPQAYRYLPKFYILISGDVFECASLYDAQIATARFPQDATVTLMTPAAREKYFQKQPLAA
jgi:hypothetical protein